MAVVSFADEITRINTFYCWTLFSFLICWTRTNFDFFVFCRCLLQWTPASTWRRERDWPCYKSRVSSKIKERSSQSLHPKRNPLPLKARVAFRLAVKIAISACHHRWWRAAFSIKRRMSAAVSPAPSSTPKSSNSAEDERQAQLAEAWYKNIDTHSRAWAIKHSCVLKNINLN